MVLWKAARKTGESHKEIRSFSAILNTARTRPDIFAKLEDPTTDSMLRRVFDFNQELGVLVVEELKRTTQQIREN